MTVTSPPANAAAQAVASWYPGRTADTTAEAVASMAALPDLAEAEADEGAGSDEAAMDDIEPAAGTEAGDDVAVVGEERGA